MDKGQALCIWKRCATSGAAVPANAFLNPVLRPHQSSHHRPWVPVSSVAVQSDGRVLIGGYLTTVNGVLVAGIARLWGADFPPQIKSISRTGADVNLSWYAISNRTYRVQYNGNLSGTNWTDLAGDVFATSATASKTDTTFGSANQRFYRVVLLP
ncbi:MAG: hypothetical protein DME26_05120 [Verrucomicrobia bacterium]|nr:MAG: hypothetical protein DME26_05120 [Verrucomicrobiota bacterium]